MVAGVAIGWTMAGPFAATALALWLTRLRAEYQAAAHQGRAVSGRADRERPPSAADAAGVDRSGGVAGAAAEFADVLLDDRLLLHGG